MEQQFKMRQIEDALNHPDAKKEDIITIFLGYKDSRRDDLRKAIHYLQNELENDILHPSAASRRIPEKFPGEEQYYASFTDIAEAFDR